MVAPPDTCPPLDGPFSRFTVIDSMSLALWVSPEPASPPMVTDVPDDVIVCADTADTARFPTFSPTSPSRVVVRLPVRSTVDRKTPIDPKPPAPPSMVASRVCWPSVCTVRSPAGLAGEWVFRVSMVAPPVTLAAKVELSVMFAFPPAPAAPSEIDTEVGLDSVVTLRSVVALTTTPPPPVTTLAPFTPASTVSAVVTSAREIPNDPPTAPTLRAEAATEAESSAFSRASTVSDVESPAVAPSVTPSPSSACTTLAVEMVAEVPDPLSATPSSLTATDAATATRIEEISAASFASISTGPPAVSCVAAPPEAVCPTTAAMVLVTVTDPTAELGAIATAVPPPDATDSDPAPPFTVRSLSSLAVTCSPPARSSVPPLTVACTVLSRVW